MMKTQAHDEALSAQTVRSFDGNVVVLVELCFRRAR